MSSDSAVAPSAMPGAERLTVRRLGGVSVLAAAHAVNDSYTYILQALLPAIIPLLGLTVGLAGGLVSVYLVMASVLQPLIGHLADRGSLRWPAWVGVVGSGVGAGLLGLAPNPAALVGLLILGGLGTALFHPVSAAMVGAAAPAASRGRWLGLYVTAGFFGTAAGPLMLSPLLEQGGPAATWPIALPALVMGVLVLLLAPGRGGPKRVSLSLMEVLRNYGRVLAVLLLVVGLRAWGAAALITFIPLLAVQRGLSPAEAAQALSAYLFGGAFGGMIGGFAADRLGRDRVAVGWLLLSVPFSLYVALSGDAGTAFLAATVLGGFFLNGSYVVLLIRGQESVPGSVGMVNGIMLGLSVGLGGLAVAPLAALSEVIGLAQTTAVAAVLGGLAALTMRLLPRAPS